MYGTTKEAHLQQNFPKLNNVLTYYNTHVINNHGILSWFWYF